MRLRSLPLAVMLAVAAVSPGAGAATTLVTEISNASADETTPFKSFNSRTFAAGDFDGDGAAEIVSFNDNLKVYVLASDRSDVLAEIQTPYPSGFTAEPHNDPAVADVDGDGALDIVTINTAGYTCVYEYDAAGSTSSSFDFDQRWCKRASTYASFPIVDAGPWVEDVTGDGKMEIFMQTETRGYFAYRHDGTVLWSKDKGGGNAGAVVTDLTNDGSKEVLFFGDAGEVRAIDAKTGSTKWEFFASRYVWPASIPTTGAAGDLDGDGKKEIVFIARDAHDEVDLQENDFMMFVLRSDGTLKWRVQPEWGQPMSTTHPVIVDLDGDGDREIVGGDWNTMGHKPGAWEHLGRNNVFAYDKSGVLLWRRALDNSHSNDDIAVMNVDGDPALEVLAISAGPNGEGVYYLDAKTGVKEEHVGVGPWGALKGPVAADLDSDGDTDWFVSLSSSTKGGAFRVYKTDGPCRGPFGGWQIRDPCDLTSSEPGGGDDGSDDNVTFDATFSGVKGNEWWIETKVLANAPLVGVDARVNGGSWRPLSLRSWGAWAASSNVPAGAQVQFQARASSEADLSGCYRWPDAVPVTCSSGGDGGGGDTGAFDATFKDPRGNAWWVEVDVSATGGTLAGVDARVDGGAWVALEKRSWGSWAKSLSAPAGSKVEFRARSTAGEIDRSSAYTWPPG